MDMDERFFNKLLLPGDLLLYSRRGVFGWLIRHVSNGYATHCETYIGNGKTIASRDGVGVGTYALNLDGLYMVLRPKRPLDMSAVMAWQKTVDGQKYDWFGLVRAFVGNRWAVDNNKMWCSEHSCQVQRVGGNEPFSDPEDTPADSVTPSDFIQSGAFFIIWKTKTPH
jgi:hypothetical protein